jgi:hypothetical protein
MAKCDGSDRLKNTLSFQALLYAGGELDEEDSKVFEQRLADDQTARDALCQASQVLESGHSQNPLGPDPGYRQKVLLQLSGGSNFWEKFFAIRPQRGHPLLWGLCGAAAALLLLVGFEKYEAGQVKNAESPALGTPNESISTQALGIQELGPLAETADIWADMHPSDHLLKARDDEVRRRVRALERSRLLKYEERRNRSEEASKPL